MRFAIDMLSRKNRPATLRSRDTRRASIHRAAAAAIESLENRQLLASVSGGQFGVFQGPNGQAIRINLTGSGSLDFIGATRDNNGNARLNDIPMTIFDAAGNVIRENLGGYGGRRGIERVEEVLGDGVGNSKFSGDDFPYSGVPQGQFNGSGFVNMDGLAATNTGQLYGVNRFQVGVGPVSVDIVRIDSKSGNVVQLRDGASQMLDLLQDVNPLINLGDIRDVIGADFSPNAQNQLRFAVNINFPVVTDANGSVTRIIVPALFTYNLNSGNVSGLDQAFFGFSGDVTDLRTVDDFTFLDDGTLAIFGRLPALNGAEALQGIFESDPDFAIMDPSGFRSVQIPAIPPATTDTPVTSVAAIEAIPGEDYYIAVTGTGNGTTTLNAGTSTNAQLYRIDIASGDVTVIGPAVDVDEPTTVTVKLGERVRDLAWNPRSVDNFFQPGKRGVLLGGDSNRDTLVAYDIRERFQNTDLYAVYGENVSPDLSVAISAFTPSSNPNFSFNRQLFEGILDPYSGSAGTIRTNMSAGLPQSIALGNGALYLGIREPDETAALTQPVLGLSSTTDFVGGKPGVSLPKLVRPGVYLSGTIRDFFFGGTITGTVNINGSVDTFYAGNVVTGDPLNGAENPDNNFFVNGDLRNLIVRGGIGTLSGANDLFAPNTELLINGRVQQVKAGDSYRGAIDIGGKTSEQTIGAALRELEFVPNTNTQNRERLAFDADIAGANGTFQLVDPVSRNDNPQSAQLIGSYFSKNRKRGGQATLNGELNNGPNFGDGTDYYGLPLLAGQTIQVQVEATGAGAIFYSIIDPDGRIYAEDRSNQNGAFFSGQAIQLTTDKPGVWKVRVTAAGGSVDLSRPYAVTLDKLGEMGIGGLVTGTGASSGDGPTSDRVYLDRADLGLRVRSGDLGAIVANGLLEAAFVTLIAGRDSISPNPIQASNGNVRAITAVRIGRENNGATGNFPALSVPRGSVGQIRADRDIYINMGQLTISGLEPSRGTIIGGDVQVIETPEDFAGTVVTNGSIGVIRVGTFGAGPDPQSNPFPLPFEPGYIGINHDDKGSAELGLIDVIGNLGTFALGGPVIDVGQGGNARYLNVGGLTYRAARSGTGGVQVLTGRNRAVNIQDDSGATITISPFDGTPITADTTGGGETPDPVDPPPPFGDETGIPDPFGDGTAIPSPFGGNPTVPDTTGGATGNPLPAADDRVGTVRVSAYPTNRGGLIVMDVHCDTGIAVSTANGVGDITNITTAGTGQDEDETPLGTAITDPLATAVNGDFTIATQSPSTLPSLIVGEGTSLDIVFSGDTTNVFSISGDAAQQNFTRILNNTDGELVNVRAGDIVALSAEYLGVSRPVNGVKIDPRTNIADSRFPNIATQSPYRQQKTAIFLNDAVDIRARGPIGNIISNGIIVNLEANSDDVNVKGVNEGVVAPIVSNSSPDDDGGIRNIDIGEGLASSGSGDFAFSGIFVEGRLGLLTNANGGGDLRGDILFGQYFERAELTGGASVLDSDILQAFDNAIGDVVVAGNRGLGTESFTLGLDIITFPGGGNISESAFNGIGDINLHGNGGLMNSRIIAYNHGKITTDKSSFGMITTEVNSTTGATMRGVDIGGLGIRASIYSGGSFINNVNATGNGKVLDVRNFSKSIRVDEYAYFDLMTGVAPNAANNINLFLGTTRKLPAIEGVTNAGVIQDSIINSARSINSVNSYEIRGVNTLGARPRDNAYPMLIQASNSIGSIRTIRNMNGVRIIGGNIESITAGRDMTQFQLESNSRVKLINVGRNYLGTANFNLFNNGSLVEFRVKGNVNGTGFAAQGIRSIIVGGNLGSARSQGGLHSGKDINILQVGGNISGSALIDADRSIKDLILAGDLEADAIVRAKSFGSQKIDGTVFGNIING
jgi:hypothetical protein